MLNEPLLRKVQDAILLNPWAFDMYNWFVTSETSPCGTAACIAGWAQVIIEGKERPVEVFDPSTSEIGEESLVYDAKRELGLDREQGVSLYKCEYWPEEFSAAYEEAREARNHEAAALIAAARIEHFIETGL